MDHHEQLLQVARHLLARRVGERGPFPSARVRKSVSTSYYALFHFLAAECGWQLIDAHGDTLVRRRILARTLTHAGMRLTFKKVAGHHAAADVSDFLRDAGAAGEPVPVPAFLRTMANVFLEAQDLRQQADYDLRSTFAALDAERLADSVESAIRDWYAANSAQENRLKNSIGVLILLRGKLRSDEF